MQQSRSSACAVSAAVAAPDAVDEEQPCALADLLQLALSTGESLAAADLAAFVELKQQAGRLGEASDRRTSHPAAAGALTPLWSHSGGTLRPLRGRVYTGRHWA